MSLQYLTGKFSFKSLCMLGQYKLLYTNYSNQQISKS